MKRTSLDLQKFSYHEPTQPRAARTFTRILNTALSIIERESIDALNTNKVAKECGINISTLYHYFPNKDSIIYALYQQWFKKVSAITQQHLTQLTSESDPKDFFTIAIHDILTIDGYSPKAAIALEQSVKVRAELAAYDQHITELSIAFYMQVLEAFGVKTSENEGIIAGTFMLMGVWGAISIAADSGKDQYPLICDYAAGSMVAALEKAAASSHQ